jgi:hypothetical protein
MLVLNAAFLFTDAAKLVKVFHCGLKVKIISQFRQINMFSAKATHLRLPQSGIPCDISHGSVFCLFSKKAVPHNCP